MRKRRPQRQSPAPFLQDVSPETNPQLGAAILEVVDTQLRDGSPPETRQTFDRLVAEGHTPEGARQLIAQLVVREIFAVMSRGERYNTERYIAGLHRLPMLPENED